MMILANNHLVWETILIITKDHHPIIALVVDHPTPIILNQALIITITMAIWCSTHKDIRHPTLWWWDQITERQISECKMANSHLNLMVRKEWEQCSHKDLNKIWIEALITKIKGQVIVIQVHSVISNQIILACKTIWTTNTINQTKWCIMEVASHQRLNLEVLKQ